MYYSGNQGVSSEYLGFFFFVQPLFHALNFYIGSFHQKFGEIFLNYVILLESYFVNSQNLLQKQLHECLLWLQK
jgi:hypothetical protein